MRGRFEPHIELRVAQHIRDQSPRHTGGHGRRGGNQGGIGTNKVAAVLPAGDFPPGQKGEVFV